MTHLLDGGLAEVLQATHADLSGQWRERMLADHARAAVLDAADRLGRRLVLMVENLQSLCGDVEEAPRTRPRCVPVCRCPGAPNRRPTVFSPYPVSSTYACPMRSPFAVSEDRPQHHFDYGVSRCPLAM